MRIYYAFEFGDAENTITGTPHPTTAKFNILGNAYFFVKFADCQAWVNLVPEKRILVKDKRKLRKFFQGISVPEYKNMINYFIKEAHELKVQYTSVCTANVTQENLK